MAFDTLGRVRRTGAASGDFEGYRCTSTPKCALDDLPPDPIHSVSFADHDRMVCAVAEYDRQRWVDRWGLEGPGSGRVERLHAEKSGNLWRIVVASSGNLLIELNTSSVVVRRAPGYGAEIVPHAPRSFSAAVDSDESRIITGGEDGRMQLWDAQTLQRLMEQPPGYPPAVQLRTASPSASQAPALRLDSPSWSHSQLEAGWLAEHSMSARDWDAQAGTAAICASQSEAQVAGVSFGQARALAVAHARSQAALEVPESSSSSPPQAAQKISRIADRLDLEAMRIEGSFGWFSRVR